MTIYSRERQPIDDPRAFHPTVGWTNLAPTKRALEWFCSSCCPQQKQDAEDYEDEA